MISEFILNIVFNLVEGVFSILPAFDWNVKGAFFQGALDMLRLAGYLLPMGTVVAILLIINTLMAVRIAVSVIKTVWELLPLV